MKIITSVLAVFLFCQAGSLWASTGRDIFEKAFAKTLSLNEKIKTRPTPKSMKLRMTIDVIEKDDITKSEFEVWGKMSENGLGKILISFIHPTGIKMLVNSREDREFDSWVKMSSGRVRKVSVDAGRSIPVPMFSDSHFNFEGLNLKVFQRFGLFPNNPKDKNMNFLDSMVFSQNNFNVFTRMEGKKRHTDFQKRLDKIDFKYLGDKSVAGFDCYQVELIPQKKENTVNLKTIYSFRKADYFVIKIENYSNRNHSIYQFIEDKEVAGELCHTSEFVIDDEEMVYNKGIVYFRTSDFYPLRIDFYKNGKFNKYLEFHDFKKIDNVLIPQKIVMTLANHLGRSELTMKSVEINAEIDNSKFNKNAL